jgi:hypothetical protein
MYLVKPKAGAKNKLLFNKAVSNAGAKHELLFNKRVSVCSTSSSHLGNKTKCDRIHNNDYHNLVAPKAAAKLEHLFN